MEDEYTLSAGLHTIVMEFYENGGTPESAPVPGGLNGAARRPGTVGRRPAERSAGRHQFARGQLLRVAAAGGEQFVVATELDDATGLEERDPVR